MSSFRDWASWIVPKTPLHFVCLLDERRDQILQILKVGTADHMINKTGKRQVFLSRRSHLLGKISHLIYVISDPITRKSPIAPNVFTECHSSGPSQFIFLACTEEDLNPCQQSQPTMHHQTCMFKQFTSTKQMHKIMARWPMSSLYIIASLSKCNMRSNKTFTTRCWERQVNNLNFHTNLPLNYVFYMRKNNYQSKNI